MEIWDGLDEEGNLIGVDLVRGGDVPSGIYHLICEVLVEHINGSFLLMQRDEKKPSNPGKYEASAGGSAVKGEDSYSCIKRELYEETGIVADNFTYIGKNINKHGIYHSYHTVVDIEPDSIRLQENETISYRWLSREEFKCFINSGEAIKNQVIRYTEFYKKRGILS